MKNQFKNLTYLDIAKRTGLTRQTVSKIIQSNGTSGTVQNLYKVLDALEMNLKGITDVGGTLKKLRLKNNISQQKMAQMISVSKPTISALEQSKGSSEHLFKAFEALSFKLKPTLKKEFPKQLTMLGLDSGNDFWLTPKNLLAILYETVGGFDLDPCSNSLGDDANVKAKNHYIHEDNGLEKRWEGKVFANPPYSHLKDWMEKAYAESLLDDGVKILLVPARLHMKYWDEFVYGKADVLMFRDRLIFESISGQM
jgi:phage N-6-adenine-methyltransferase